MKRLSVLLITLLLAGCAEQTPEIASGEVLPCTDISYEAKWVGGPEVECLDGTPGLQLSALRGPMVVNVWGSWCVTCKAEMPYFRSFYEKAKGKVELVGVAVEEAKPQDAKDFVVRNGITWPNLIDTQGSSRSYFGMGVPVTWFIDKAGVVTFKKSGEIRSEKELVTLTNKYLGVDLS